MVGASRSPGSVEPIILAEERFSRNADHERSILNPKTREVGEQLEIVLQRFSESNSRIKRDGHGINPALYGARILLSKKITHFRHHIIVVRIRLHGARRSLHVHDDEPRAAFGRQGHHLSITASGRDVVDDLSAGLERRARDLRL